MAAEVQPAELAALLDLAERPRVEGWSLRAALVRYAQPEPQRASDLMELVRRIEGALRSRAKVLEREGPEVWAALQGAGDGGGGEVDPALVALLEELRRLDAVGDRLATWAVDRVPPRPDDAVDEAVSDVRAGLDALGIEREERRPPPGMRRRG